MALAVGVFLTTTAICNRHYPKVAGFTPTQLNVDSFMVQAVGFYALWVVIWPAFTFWDLILGALCSVLTIVGNIFTTTAFRHGLGGPIMAIDSCKSLVILLFNVIVTGILPSTL